ncbi:MAG: protoporphyrinogen oxidase [Candidatus Methanofastidiosum methylothiophilum]|nr:MAG: protoporphyrinogen oxidase [Candidatus Methanofastidiosum methylthiophilus]
MAKNVLVVYGSRYGCTEEVSKEIVKVLEKEGLEVSLVNLESTKDAPDVKNFDAVLVGSGIKIGKWTKGTDNFLKKNKTQLKDKTLGLYTCSGLAMEDAEKAKKMYVEEKMEDLGIDAQLFDVFPGKSILSDFDLSNPNIGFIERKIIEQAAKAQAKDNKPIKIDEKWKNDPKGWEEIKSFASKFAKMVKSK